MANDFSGDANCVALWRFENGALTTDTIGGNTLTDHNTVGTETGDYKEGSACADLEKGNSEYFSIADADLDADFPLKNGDTNKKISICAWFKQESQHPETAIISKYDTGSGKRSLLFRIDGTTLKVYIGHSGGGNAEELYSGSSLSTGRWYHLGFTFDDADKSWKLVLWDDTAGSKLINTSGTATNNINIEDASFGIGAMFSSGSPWYFFDGLIDEILVFKDILTTGEIDEIRAGTYSVGEQTELVDVSLNLSAYHQDLEDFAAWLRAHDGLELEDIKTLLAALAEQTEDLPAHLSAYYQDMEDLKLHLQTWAWRTDDVKTLLEAQGLSLTDVSALLRAVAYRYENIKTFLSAVDSTVLTDLAAYLSATDGTVNEDVSLYLAAIALVPAYRAVTAQRLTSVVSEVI